MVKRSAGAYRTFLSNLSLNSVLLVSVDAERHSRDPVAKKPFETDGWAFTFVHEINDDGTELNVRVKAEAESSTVAIQVQYQLQYDFNEPVEEVPNEVAMSFLAESVVPTVAPYIRELTHTLGMRMQCDIPWLNIVGPPSLGDTDDS